MIWHALVFTAAVWACARPPLVTWDSIPEVQQVEGSTCNIQWQPLRGDAPYFQSFLLRIQNLGDQPLEVDWNQTRYLHGGEDLGVFVFEGIDPDRVQGAIPPDRIAAGETFAKTISPLKTVAFLPREQVPEPGRRGFMPGVLPAGENSIRLALQQGDRQWQQTLSVRLVTRTQQP
jgi:hypothetical protein